MVSCHKNLILVSINYQEILVKETANEKGEDYKYMVIVLKCKSVFTNQIQP